MIKDGHQKPLPSDKWTSYRYWNWRGFKERLELFMQSIDKEALVKHAESINGEKMKLSEPFSAGQHWCCFELVGEEGALVIARVRLPKHPDEEEQSDPIYSIDCELATMRFVREHTSIPVPAVYAYEPQASERAMEVGAPYMLIEGFYGNTIFDVNFDITELELSTQEHIITQWTAIQAELASISFPTIGSICSYSKEEGPIIGKLSYAELDGLAEPGPFDDGIDFHMAIYKAKYLQARKDQKNKYLQLGLYICLDVLDKSPLFKENRGPPFHLNHMDLGVQNLVVDADFNIIGVIDWEFAQTAPPEVNHYLMPFTPDTIGISSKEILKDPQHRGYENVRLQETGRRIYYQRFKDAEAALAARGKALPVSIADTLEKESSRLIYVMEQISRAMEHELEDFVYEIVRVGLGLEGERAVEYVRQAEEGMNHSSLI